MRARVAYILTMDEPAQKELWASYLPTQELPRQPDNACEDNVCALVLQSWPDLFLTLSTAGSEAGWEREGSSFPQLSLVFHCLRKKLPNVDLSTPVLPDYGQPTSDTSDGKFPGRRKGIAQQGCVNTRRVLQSSTQCLSSQAATRPSQSPGRQAGTEPQGLLALTTTRCLLQTS